MMRVGAEFTIFTNWRSRRYAVFYMAFTKSISAADETINILKEIKKFGVGNSD